MSKLTKYNTVKATTGTCNGEIGPSGTQALYTSPVDKAQKLYYRSS